MTRRNGTPPWLGPDDVDHEPCTHRNVRTLLPLLTTGSIECIECGRIVNVDEMSAA